MRWTNCKITKFNDKDLCLFYSVCWQHDGVIYKLMYAYTILPKVKVLKMIYLIKLSALVFSILHYGLYKEGDDFSVTVEKFNFTDFMLSFRQ